MESTIMEILIDEIYGLAALKTLINTIDTSVELQARFDEIKGAGWTVETLKAINDNITSIDLSELALDATVAKENTLAQIKGANFDTDQHSLTKIKQRIG